MKKFIFTLAAILCTFVSQNALAQDAKDLIKEFYVEKQIEKPEQLAYLGPGSGVFFLFGAVGGLALHGANLTPAQALKEHAEKNNVLIENIVAEEIVAEFKRSEKFVIIDEAEKAKLTLKMSIRMYGFSIPHGFSSKLVPTLSVVCEFIDKKEEVVWSDRNGVLPLGNPAESVTAEELKDPETIRKLWQIAAQTIAKKFVTSF